MGKKTRKTKSKVMTNTDQIIHSIKSSKPDHNNMRVWNGFFFDSDFKLPEQMPEGITNEQRTQWFLKGNVFEKYAIDINAGIYVHDTDKDFYQNAPYVANIFDQCCVFPFTGKEWHGVDGRGIKDTRKLLYIDWMK